MIYKKIIPCLDVRNGKVVKGINFEGIKEVGDPIKLAKLYNEKGADELVLYDISAFAEKRTVDLELVKNVVRNISVPFCVAGGITTLEDYERVLEAGANKVSINSPAVKNPNLISLAVDKFGRESIVVGIDAKRVIDGTFTVTMSCGKIETGMNLIDWVKRIEELGAGEICLNSMDADGMKTGYDIEMINTVCENVSIPVIASGGCGKIEHFYEVFEKTKASSALAASVFHFGELDVNKVKKYLQKEGIMVKI